MTRSLGALFLVVVLASCEPEPQPPPTPPPPPLVSLTLLEGNVIGDSVKGRVNVTGCKTVAQVQLLQGNNEFLYDVQYKNAATDFTLPAGLFSAIYPRVGIAASITLRAKAICDDARTANSQPVGLKFFPIAQRLTAADGSQMVPDNFIAEGGFGGTPNTFLGCAVISTGTTIVRVNTRGEVLGYIASMPFNCSLATQISDRSNVTGTRWVLEPNVGVFAFKNDLTIVKSFRNQKVLRMGVGAKGSAVVWVDEGGSRNRIMKMDPVATTVNDWETEFHGVIMNSDPVIDDAAGNSVWVSGWQMDVGTKIADIVPYQYDLSTGQLRNGLPQLGGFPASILRQEYPMLVSEPIIPQGFFSPDGAFFTLPLISLNAMSSTIVSCSTSPSSPNCEGAARRWTSPTFNGIFRLVVPFSQNNMVAAVSPFGVFFLNNQLGSVINLGEQPLTPSGSQLVVGVRPGAGQDFYILTGPNYGPGVASWPTEIIATDGPSAGELWRLEFGSGESSANAMYMSIDEANQVWVRTGLDLIKPLPNTEYRMARGPTMLP